MVRLAAGLHAGPLRRHAGCLLLLCLIAPLYLAWTGTDQIGALDSDGPAYLMMARHYAAGTLDHSTASVAASYTRFPPLYPLSLSWFHAADDLRRTHAVTTGFLLLALLAYYFWLSGEGLPRWQACLLVATCAAMPGSWLPGLTVQSEYLYLCLSLLALAGLSAYRRSPRDEVLYLAALAIAASLLTRSIGVVLLPCLLGLARQAPRRTVLFALLLAAAPALLWSAAHRGGSGYSGALAAAYGAQPLRQLQEQLGLESLALYRGLLQNFSQAPPALPSSLLFGALGLLGLGAAIARARRLMPDGLYALAYSGVLLLWPYPDESRRLLWPLLPVLLGQLLIAARTLPAASMRRWASGACAAAAGGALLCSLPSIALAAERRSTAPQPQLRGMLYWYEADAARARRWADTDLAIAAALRRAGEALAKNDCVLSVRPELVNYLADRHSTYPPPDAVPEAAFRERLRSSGCRYVFMTSRTYAGYPSPMYPLQRLGEALTIIDQCELPAGDAGAGTRVCALGRLQ